MGSRKTVVEMTLQPGWNWQSMLDRLASRCLQLDPNKPWKIEVSLAVKSRSGEANAALWGVAYPSIREQTGEDDLELLHHQFCGAYFGWVDKELLGERVRRPFRTTTTDENGERNVLSRAEFAEFYEFVQRKCAEHDIIVPDPDPDLSTKPNSRKLPPR